MTLMETERIKVLHLQKKQTLTLTLQELSFYTEIQYKTFDIWIKEGFIPPSHIRTGVSGHDRSFTYEGCFITLLLGQLTEAGFGAQKMRELMPTFLELIDEPYGYMAIDLIHPGIVIHVQGDYTELSNEIREHFGYGSSSPMVIYDLNKLHIKLLDMSFDADMRWELRTAAMHMGDKVDWTNVRGLVTLIDDLQAYEAAKAKGKPSRSRFR